MMSSGSYKSKNEDMMVLTTEGVSLGNEGYRQQNQEICTAAVCVMDVRGRQEGENDVRWRKEGERSERNESSETASNSKWLSSVCTRRRHVVQFSTRRFTLIVFGSVCVCSP